MSQNSRVHARYNYCTYIRFFFRRAGGATDEAAGIACGQPARNRQALGTGRFRPVEERRQRPLHNAQLMAERCRRQIHNFRHVGRVSRVDDKNLSIAICILMSAQRGGILFLVEANVRFSLVLCVSFTFSSAD